MTEKPPSLRERQAKLTQDEILKAARRLFAERGYEGASLRAIGAEAGVDAALVVHFFGSKAKLLTASVRWPFDPDVAIPQSRSSFFSPEALALQSEYVNGRTADLEKRWWALSVRLYNSPEFDNWRLRPLIDAQLGVSLNWRVSLSNHAAAIKSRDPIRIDAARAELERANDLTTEVLGYSN